MPEFSFAKLSPGGNTTIFLPLASAPRSRRAALAQQVLSPDMLGGEQVGYVDVEQRRLYMAGGEFCCNASRAFGALLTHELGPQDSPWRIVSSGWPTPVNLDVMGDAPEYTVTATLDLPESVTVQTLDRGLALVRLPGIDHFLLDPAVHREPAYGDTNAGTRAIERLAIQAGLGRSPCIGAIWWDSRAGQLSMRPLVHVRAIATTFFESACGSGALALALWLAGGKEMSFAIGQPSGQPLYVDIVRGAVRARITGPVTMLAQGRVWLNG